ncbi:MAG: hypothetical protein K2X39_01700, partial [Silvanigrellaceae bacterium]|nr:hypothetical protein [Silvanigrellaceae bacterium]
MFSQSYAFKGLPLVWWLKCAAVVFAFVFAIVFTLPSFLGDEKQWKRDSVGRAEVWYQALAESFLPSSRISLGLDLKGGLSLTLNVDINKSVHDSIARAAQRAKEIAQEKGIEVGHYEIGPDFKIKIKIDNEEKAKKFSQFLTDQTTLLLYGGFEGDLLTMLPNRSLIESFDKQVMQQAINTIRNRIDQFGVAEPNIFQAGDSRIVVELPGLNNSERAKQLIGNTAQLDFRLVLNDVAPSKLVELLNEARTALKKDPGDHQANTIEELSQWLRDQKLIALHSTILLQRHIDENQRLDGRAMVHVMPYLVEAQSRLAGDLIQDATSGQSAENYLPEFAVFLKFKPLGAKIFGELTKEALEPKNKPHQIAIVLDGNVQ